MLFSYVLHRVEITCKGLSFKHSYTNPGKNLSSPAFPFLVQCNGNPSKEGSTLLSWRGLFRYPTPASYCVQESVVFLLRNQIKPLLIFSKVSSLPPASCVTCGLLCLLIAQTRATDKIHPAIWIALKSNQFYMMQWQGNNGKTSSPLILRKMWSSGFHST